MNHNSSQFDHNFSASTHSAGGQYYQSADNKNIYRYVYNGNPQPPKRQKEPKGGRVGWILLTVILSACISFGAGFCGVFYANQTIENAKTDETINPSPDKNDLYHSDPESVVQKADSVASPFGSAGEDVFSVSQVVQMVQDSVVVIDATVVTGTTYWGEEQTSTSAGSGVIISADGLILTCHHVVANPKSITVTLKSGSKYEASLVGSDAESDLAVIRIKPLEDEPLVYAEQGCSADLVVGEKVVAIGNPLGTLGGTVTDGIISATERNIVTSEGSQMTLLQTNAAINSGNSGGGLFNLDGKLIGIVNAKYASAGVEGLAFAIPIDSAYTVQLDLIEFGFVRGIIDHGLTTLDVTQENLNYYHYRYGISSAGVYVVSSDVSKEIQNKDRIVSINGEKITTSEEMNRIMDKYKVGDVLSIVLLRDETELTVQLTLEEYVPDSVKERLQ